jgi:hypothetical protein
MKTKLKEILYSPIGELFLSCIIMALCIFTTFGIGVGLVFIINLLFKLI